MNRDAVLSQNGIVVLRRNGVRIDSKELGHGTSGTVYRGCQLAKNNVDLDKPCAVKWHHESPDGIELPRDFQNEIRAAKELRTSPYFVRFIEAIFDQGFLFTLWELGQCSLRDVIKRHSSGISRDECFAYLLNVAQGLDLLHGRPNEPVHADIKPGNLIVFDDSVVKIGDFGTMRFRESLTSLTSAGATHEYCPPRLLHKQISERDDFAFAVCYAELRMGHHPCGDSTEILANLRAGRFNLEGLDNDESKALRAMWSEKYRSASLEQWLRKLQSTNPLASRADNPGFDRADKAKRKSAMSSPDVHRKRNPVAVADDKQLLAEEDGQKQTPDPKNRGTHDNTKPTHPQYEFLEVLGSGGMGEVWKALEPALDRHVAIKRLRRDKILNPETMKRFRREARAAARLKQENVVPVYNAVDDDDGNLLIVMELMEGGNLVDRLKEKGPLDPLETVRIGRQMCRALIAAHSKQVIHRDVKPGNILLTLSGRAKLADFGVARIEQEVARLDSESRLETATGASVGTPDFMAPEQHEHDRQIDHRCDIWGLGATLYYLLTRESLPLRFHGNDRIDALLPTLLQAKPEVQDFQNVLLKALAVNPKQRYQTAAEFNAALAEIERQLLADSDGVSRIPLGKIDPRSQRINVWSWSLVTAVIGVALGAFFLQIGLRAGIPYPSGTNSWGIEFLPFLLATSAGLAQFSWQLKDCRSSFIYIAGCCSFPITLALLHAVSQFLAGELSLSQTYLLASTIFVLPHVLLASLIAISAGLSVRRIFLLPFAVFASCFYWSLCALAISAIPVLAARISLWTEAGRLTESLPDLTRDPVLHSFGLIGFAIVGVVIGWRIGFKSRIRVPAKSLALQSAFALAARKSWKLCLLAVVSLLGPLVLFEYGFNRCLAQTLDNVRTLHVSGMEAFLTLINASNLNNIETLRIGSEREAPKSLKPSEMLIQITTKQAAIVNFDDREELHKTVLTFEEIFSPVEEGTDKDRHRGRREKRSKEHEQKLEKKQIQQLQRLELALIGKQMGGSLDKPDIVVAPPKQFLVGPELMKYWEWENRSFPEDHRVLATFRHVKIRDDEMEKEDRSVMHRQLSRLMLGDPKYDEELFSYWLNKNHQATLEISKTVLDRHVHALTRMKSLKHLDLRFCVNLRGSGLRFLSELPYLESLNLFYCKGLKEGSFQQLGRLKALRSLRLARTVCTDSRLSHFTRLHKLEWIDLRHNPALTDKSFRYLANLKSLRFIDVNGCRQMTGRGLSKLPRLEGLFMAKCGLTDSSIAEIEKLDSLKGLDVSLNLSLTSESLKHLNGMKHLRMLSLAFNYKLTQSSDGTAVPLEFPELPELEVLDLSNTGINDKDLLNLSKLSALRVLDIRGNTVTLFGIAQLHEELPDCQIVGVDQRFVTDEPLFKIGATRLQNRESK